MHDFLHVFKGKHISYKNDVIRASLAGIMALLVSHGQANLVDGGCTLGDSLDDANRKRLGDIGRETPMSTARVVLPEC